MNPAINPIVGDTYHAPWKSQIPGVLIGLISIAIGVVLLDYYDWLGNFGRRIRAVILVAPFTAGGAILFYLLRGIIKGEYIIFGRNCFQTRFGASNIMMHIPYANIDKIALEHGGSHINIIVKNPDDPQTFLGSKFMQEFAAKKYQCHTIVEKRYGISLHEILAKLKTHRSSNQAIEEN